MVQHFLFHPSLVTIKIFIFLTACVMVPIKIVIINILSTSLPPSPHLHLLILKQKQMMILSVSKVIFIDTVQQLLHLCFIRILSKTLPILLLQKVFILNQNPMAQNNLMLKQEVMQYVLLVGVSKTDQSHYRMV